MSKLHLLALLSASFASAQTVPALSVNGASEARIEPGWPVIIAAQANETAPILAVSGPAEITLEKREVAEMFVWTLSPETTGSLVPGVYTIRAEKGKPVTFEIRIAGTAEDAPRRAERLMLFSEYASLAGDKEKALAYVDELLAADPESVAARLKKADLLEAEGKLPEALRMLDEADIIVRRQNPAHPPALIRKRQADLLDRMLI